VVRRERAEDESHTSGSNIGALSRHRHLVHSLGMVRAEGGGIVPYPAKTILVGRGDKVQEMMGDKVQEMMGDKVQEMRVRVHSGGSGRSGGDECSADGGRSGGRDSHYEGRWLNKST
jgi:hypothetical protein